MSMTETFRDFDGVEMECTSTATYTIWADPQSWPVGRDKNTCVVHLEIAKISGTDTTVRIVAQDSSGRIFADMALSGTITFTAKNNYRYVFTNFGANLKLGLKLSCSANTGNASVSMEHTLKAY